MPNALEIDASEGGQIFRNSLAFSCLSGKAVEIKRIREARQKPGLQRQHLATLNTMKALTSAKVKGARLGSSNVYFEPSAYKGGNYSINIGSAGSITLLLQSVMLPSLKKKTSLRITGGTDVPFSPPFNYAKEILLPAFCKMNARFSLDLVLRGYYPEGGGIVKFSSKESKAILPLKITERGQLEKISLYSHSYSSQKQIALNQISAAKKVLSERLGSDLVFEENIDFREISGIRGNGIEIVARFEKSSIASNALGIKGKDAVSTGNEAANKLLEEIASCSAVDRHFADQITPFAAIAKGKTELLCSSMTAHLRNALKLAELFFGISYSLKEETINEKSLFTLSIEGKGVDFND